MAGVSEERAVAALEASGLTYTLTRHGRVGSLEEAADLRGLSPRDIVKTLVVRRAEDDMVLVLVPGDRQIDWALLRQALGVNRLSLPDAEQARLATGYERGTITPFGSTTAWPVVADDSLVQDAERTISVGAGAHGVAATVRARAALEFLGAQVAPVTKPG